MTFPHYINELHSGLRGVKEGWYAIDERGRHANFVLRGIFLFDYFRAALPVRKNDQNFIFLMIVAEVTFVRQSGFSKAP